MLEGTSVLLCRCCVRGSVVVIAPIIASRGRFLSSYAQTSPAGEVLVAPTSVLDHWMKRFEEKFSRDPTFLYRAKD